MLADGSAGFVQNPWKCWLPELDSNQRPGD